MVNRLVLGCDATSLSLVEALAERRGDLVVLEPDENRVESLRNNKVPARETEHFDAQTLEALDIDPGVVLLLGADPNQNARAAQVSSQVFPAAYRVGFAGENATATEREAIAEHVTRLIKPGGLLVDFLLERLGDGNLPRLKELRETLWEMGGSLAVFTHDNPDPDAIGSALALCSIAEWFDVEADVYYYGDISHQENRAFVNLLDFDLTNVEHDAVPEFDHLALVDHSAPGVNNQLPEDTPVDVVIDHHPSRGGVEASFVDIRSETGATSTLMIDYITGYEIDIETEVATGLLYGIRVDTRDFSQEITERDFEAAAELLPQADMEALGRIESPSVSPETLDTVARSIRNRRIRGMVLTSCVGPISSRDALAQAADRLLNMENTQVTVVYGYRDGTIYLSARSRGVDMDLGDTLRRAFDGLGSAGGHSNMAGAQISMGIFDALDEEAGDELTEIVEDVIESRFFEAVSPEDLEE